MIYHQERPNLQVHIPATDTGYGNLSPRASTAWSGCSWKLQSYVLMWRNWRCYAAKLRGAHGRSDEQVEKNLFDGHGMVIQILLRGCHFSWLIYTWDERSSSLATWPALVRQFPWKPRGAVAFAKLADEGRRANLRNHFGIATSNTLQYIRCTMSFKAGNQPSPAYHERRLGKHGRWTQNY